MKLPAKGLASEVEAMPADRRGSFRSALDPVRRHIPAGYVEMFVYGMPSWSIPLEFDPNTYNQQPLTVVSLGVQKNDLALYMTGLYMHAPTDTAFRAAWAKSGKRLDTGKGCLRFAAFDDLDPKAVAFALAAITPDDFSSHYGTARGIRGKPAAKPPTTTKTR